MADTTRFESSPVIEFTTEEGLRPVGAFRREKELVERSNRALDKAMHTIRLMADSIKNTVEHIDNPPNNMEVEFGLKFDVELGVIIAKSTQEASINVKMRWDSKGRS